MKKFVSEIVIAKQNYCVPATMQMVLEHFGILGYTQDIIAEQLVIVSDNDNINHTKWGTQIKSDTLNDFFKKNQIKLHERYLHISNFMDDYFLGEKILELLKENKVIICGYNYTWLYSNCEDSYRHVSIIVDFDPIVDTVVLLDPGPREYGYKKVKLDRLYVSIKAANDGLWCIEKMKL